MNPIILLIVFLALSFSASFPPQANIPNPDQRHVPDLNTVNQCCRPCAPINPIPQANLRPSKRSHQVEISFSPSSSATNTNQSNTLGQQESSAWPPTAETILTAIFRAVVTILSLLNVNFTWRLHGMVHSTIRYPQVPLLMSNRHTRCTCLAPMEARSSSCRTGVAGVRPSSYITLFRRSFTHMRWSRSCQRQSSETRRKSERKSLAAICVCDQARRVQRKSSSGTAIGCFYFFCEKNERYQEMIFNNDS